jgi:hypothetical protein
MVTELLSFADSTLLQLKVKLQLELEYLLYYLLNIFNRVKTPLTQWFPILVLLVQVSLRRLTSLNSHVCNSQNPVREF